MVQLLNDYLSTMSDVILDEKGTIDKYEGDAIVAFFGAPLELADHALRACKSAVIMKRFEASLNKKLADEKITLLPLRTRIGINSGDMVVGNMGTKRKMNYTVMGNSVNLSSRLEGVNKMYGTWILASEHTVNEAGNGVITRRLDRIRVAGIDEPVRIYQVLDISADAPPELSEQVNLFHAALDLFEQRDWNAAEAAFQAVLEKTSGDPPSRLYIDRCRRFSQTPPENDWDGVFNFSNKIGGLYAEAAESCGN